MKKYKADTKYNVQHIKRSKPFHIEHYKHKDVEFDIFLYKTLCGIHAIISKEEFNIFSKTPHCKKCEKILEKNSRSKK